MKYYTLADALKVYGYKDASTIRHYIHDGRLKASKIGRDWVLTTKQMNDLGQIRRKGTNDAS